ncbi:MAG TPA: hypothetical protein VFI31_06970, partial [Pirellulales bacterium]|nr:hypothetical protein [Pirellulales bacterium]
QEAEVAITTAAHSLRLARNNLSATRQLIRKGFLTDAQLEPSVFAVEQAQLQLDIARRAKTVLETYNRPKMTQELRSRLETAEAVVRSTTAEFELAQIQLARCHQQLDHCVVRAPRSGLAIHANDPGRSSSETPDVALGAFIRERQKVIWLPDLSAMQVQALVHESSVLRVHAGLAGVVSVRGRELPAVVSEVATQPARTRRSQAHLKYFMVTALIDEPSPGLRPGESVDLTLLVNYRPGVLRTPLESVVKSDDGAYAWVEGDGGIESRRIELGEMGDSMAEVKRGLREGDHVVLKPRENLSEVDELLDAHLERRRDRFGQAPAVSSARRGLATAGMAGG